MKIINPYNGLELKIKKNKLVDNEGNSFPIIDEIPRIAQMENYTSNFGFQWNIFDKTQLDSAEKNITISKSRFFAETAWNPKQLNGLDILEVGSGAGRFSKVILECTKANLWSIDFSNAVNANYKNNRNIDLNRFHLFQASIYDMPFENNVFDKVFCFGVLQHTPNIEYSIKSLVSKAKPGGEIIVDFYPIQGFWTKIHAKYIFRKLFKRLNNEELLNIIKFNVNWLVPLSLILIKYKLKILTRFLPIVDITTLPYKILTKKDLYEWVILDTFDMFSPEYDNPMKIIDVVKLFKKYKVMVTFSGTIHYESNFKAAGVRGIKVQ